jgi:uncharacterized protein YggE
LTLEPAAPSADRTIVVPGLGRLTVEPDVATVRLGVAITRPTASAAREEAAETMTAILQAIAAAGVDRRDVRSSLVGLGPITDYSSERGPRVTGYQLTNSVELTVRDLSAAGKVIDAGLGAGASSLDGLEFRLADPAPAEDAARRAAVEDARRRAITLATAADVTLGSVVGIVEGSRPAPMFERGGIEGMALKAASDTPIEAGTQDVVVSVVVTFLIGGGPTASR